jgi:pimeloyl-ACP methyl ester carboxylesterase
MSYVRTRLGRWFYEERGTRRRAGDPTVVFLHGLLFDGGMWSRQIEPLAARGRVLVFDGPGHGKSEMPPPFSLEDHTDALMDSLTTLDAPTVVFVGHSWGGMIAMRAALKFAPRVKAMALLDTSADAEARPRAIKYRVFASFARRLGMPLWFVERDIAPIMFGPHTLATRPELVQQLTRTVNGYSRDGLVRAAKAVVIRRSSITDKISSIRTPTLVVCGRDDTATPPEKSEELASNIAGAKLVWIERAGHMSPIEQPDAVNDALVPFVSAQF